MRHLLVSSSLLIALLLAVGTHAADIDKKSLQVRAPVTSADTLATVRRQGAVNVNGVSWQCGGTRCTASKFPVVAVAPVTLCQGLAREVGAMRSFTAANRALSEAELRQCNGAMQLAATPTSRASSGFASALKMPAPSVPPLPSISPPKQDKPVGGFAVLPPPVKAPISAPELKNFNTAKAPGFAVAPVSRPINTPALTFDGLRFRVKTIDTPALALTGQRFVPKVFITRPIALTGMREQRLVLAKTRGFEPLIINTDSLVINGQRFRPVQFGTSSLSFTGNR